jgi:hypothetical protein
MTRPRKSKEFSFRNQSLKWAVFEENPAALACILTEVETVGRATSTGCEEFRSATGLLSDTLCINTFHRVLGAVSAPLDRLCGLVVRVLGYRSGGPGSIPSTTRFSEKKKQ